jgi:hypothetical protein
MAESLRVSNVVVGLVFIVVSSSHCYSSLNTSVLYFDSVLYPWNRFGFLVTKGLYPRRHMR